LLDYFSALALDVVRVWVAIVIFWLACALCALHYGNVSVYLLGLALGSVGVILGYFTYAILGYIGIG
jgi:hypothetical protein